MARPIDLDQLMKYPLRRGSEHCDEKNADPRFLNGVESILEWAQTLPTLTQPNEGGKDKNVPTNGPLTLEELRMMAEPTPVWWDWVQGWVLARKGMITTWNGRYYNSGELRGDFYRRPPVRICLVMNECRQVNCPFRSNSSSSVYGCEHIACPNRDDGSITWITTDHTITDREDETSKTHQGGPEMTRAEAIKQIESLFEHCEAMMTSDEPVWSQDCEALKVALSALRGPTREQLEQAWKPCKVCSGKTTLYQHTNTTKLLMNTFGKAATLVTECNACPPYADCCMKGISMNSAFRISYCPECGRPLTDEAVDMVMERLEALYGE